MLRRLDLPPVWAALAALAALALAQWAPILRAELPAAAALIPAAAGFGLIGWAAGGFFAARTPIEPRHDARALLTGGAFRVNRNPIYTGMALILLGLAAHLGALSALAPVAAFPVVITRRFVREEEARLVRVFGAEAEAWLARSRRW